MPQQEQVRDPFSTWSSVKYGLKLGGALMVGMPFAAAGIVFAGSIVGLPLAPLFFWLSGALLKRVVRKRTRQVTTWRARDQALSGEGNSGQPNATPPWMEDTAESDGWQPL